MYIVNQAFRLFDKTNKSTRIFQQIKKNRFSKYIYLSWIAERFWSTLKVLMYGWKELSDKGYRRENILARGRFIALPKEDGADSINNELLMTKKDLFQF